MLGDKKVSVVIPTYNRAHLVKRSVKSVLSQTYDNIEVIVIDDCSTDETGEAVAELKDERIRYIRLSVNGGSGAARNAGIARATGEIIAFQDSDDEWLPRKLELQVPALEELGADVVFCQMRRMGYSDNDDPIFPLFDRGVIERTTLIVGSSVSTQTILARRCVFESCLFDEDVPLFEDYEWTIRASRSFTFGFVDEPLVNVYLQADSKTNAEFEKRISSYSKIIECSEDDLDNDSKFRSYIYSRRAGCYRRVGDRDSAAKDYRAAGDARSRLKALLMGTTIRIGGNNANRPSL